MSKLEEKGFWKPLKDLIPGQQKADIDKARKTADKEYKRLVKKRLGKAPEIYKVNSTAKLVEVIIQSIQSYKKKTNKNIELDTELLNKIIDRLNSQRSITPEIYRNAELNSDLIIKLVKKTING